MTVKSGSLLPLLFVLPVMLAEVAQAQNFDRPETVADRSRPELDAFGLRLGAFDLYPKIGLEFIHDNNIFADDTGTVDDTITIVEPALLLKSDWGRHSLSLGSNFTSARYGDFPDEDYEDFRVWADGRLDYGSGFFSASVQHFDLHEERSSPDDRGGIKPTEYDNDAVTAKLRLRPGRFIVQARARLAKFDYDDSVTEIGPISNDDRDRNQLATALRLGFSTTPGFVPFVEAKFNDRDYDDTLDTSGFERSSSGYEVVIGSELDLTGSTFGEFYVGYREQEYDDPRFRTADGATFGGDITWNLSGLTTINVFASRTIENTTIVDSSGVEQTRLGVNVDHELLRRLILTVSASTSNEDFLGIERQEDITRFRLSGKYVLNRHLVVNIGYDYQDRDFSGASVGGLQFTISRVFLRLIGQL